MPYYSGPNGNPFGYNGTFPNNSITNPSFTAPQSTYPTYGGMNPYYYGNASSGFFPSYGGANPSYVAPSTGSSNYSGGAYRTPYYGGYQSPNSGISGSPATTSGLGSIREINPRKNTPEPADEGKADKEAASGDNKDNRSKDKVANIEVRVPADARVWFDSTPTTPTGARRRFVTPALKPGQKYTYSIRAQWSTPSGASTSEIRHITIQAGDSLTVDFTRPLTNQDRNQRLAAPRAAKS
jgi:uncharacterized protein (TIGR03000 family)